MDEKHKIKKVALYFFGPNREQVSSYDEAFEIRLSFFFDYHKDNYHLEFVKEKVDRYDIVNLLEMLTSAMVRG